MQPLFRASRRMGRATPDPPGGHAVSLYRQRQMRHKPDLPLLMQIRFQLPSSCNSLIRLGNIRSLCRDSLEICSCLGRLIQVLGERQARAVPNSAF